MEIIEITTPKKRNSDTQKEMATNGETHFQMQGHTVPSHGSRGKGDELTGPAEMRRSLVESLEEGVRGPTWRLTYSEKALAYCLEAIEETERKIRMMKAHEKKMEDDINRAERAIRNDQPRRYTARTQTAPLSYDDFDTAETDTERSRDQTRRHVTQTHIVPINTDDFRISDICTSILNLSTTQENRNNRNTRHGKNNDIIMQWNINGLRNNFEELKLLTEEIEPVIICLKETNEKPGYGMVFGYKVYSKAADTERAKHGVTLLVREGIKREKIELKTKLNAVAVKTELKRTVNICSIYLPPNERITSGQLTRLLAELPKPYIITGDINAHNRRWGSRSTNNRGDKIAKTAGKQGLNILNNGDPTHISFASRAETVIDVTLLTPDIHPGIEWYVHGDTCGSDHYPTICRFTEPNPKATKRPGWRTKAANWEGYQKTLTETLQ
jgi:hypothetical protein